MSGSVQGQTPWLAYCRPNGAAKLRLFCVPHAGGGASTYRTWPAELPAQVEVCPVQPPGRETRLREPAFRRAEPLALAAATALAPWFDRPFALFGHSMGAVIAFELARALRSQGQPMPVCVIVSGRRAPHLPDRKGPIYDLPQDELLAELAKFGGTPSEALACRELIEFMLPLLRADCEVCDEHVHVPDAPLPCPLIAYGGAADPDVNQEELEGWREHTSGAFVARMFPGDHFYLQAQRSTVLSTLARDLAHVTAGQFAGA